SDRLLAALDPEEQHEVLRDFQQACRRAAERFAGTVVKATPNGLLVGFGFPVAFEDAARRAVRTGLEVLQQTARLNERLAQRHGVRLAATVGVHSDLAIVQDAGAPGEGLSVVGSVLNVAEQLEGLATAGTVVISSDTHRLAGGCFDCAAL